MVANMVASIPPERGWRGPGCDDRCKVVQALVPGVFGRSELLLHDPDCHEEYGRATSGTIERADIVVTGTLAIDLGRMRVMVDRHPVGLSPTEMRILACLARRLDLAVHLDDVIERVWGPGYLIGSASDRAHVVRVSMARLRARIRPADALIVTVEGFGYRLIAARPDVDTVDWPELLVRRPLGDRWAKDWEACRHCETKERPHRSHGYCTPCWRRISRDWARKRDG